MPARDENGQWLPGQSGNPEGKNGWESGWVPYGIRLQKWFALPVSEIRALINDPTRFEALSSIDASCVSQVAQILMGNRGERETALDRVEGRPKQIASGYSSTAVLMGTTFTLTFGTEDNAGDKC